MKQAPRHSETSATERSISRFTFIRTRVAELLFRIPDPLIILAATFFAQTDESQAKSIAIALGILGMVAMEEII